MSLSAKLRRAPARIVTGAFILNSGLGKLKGDDDTAKMVHGMAAGAYPALEKVPPSPFLKTLAVSEVALGSALLVPFAPAALTGLGLAGFSGSLLGLYWRTPGMHEEGSLRPTQQGIGLAKDVWMLGIAVSLLLDSTLEPVHDKKIAMSHDVRASTARRALKATSAARLARAKAETKAARAARKASKRASKQALAVKGVAAAATSASRAAYDKVTP
ncbi:MAG: hypothetical protein ABI775_04915 [Pseudonocardiales bacterium]